MRWLLAETRKVETMSWGRLDDQWHRHPKVRRVSFGARGLYATMLCWSADHETDGFVPDDIVPDFMPLGAPDPTTLLALLEELLREREPYKFGLLERTSGGFLVHDFLKANPSKRELLRLRKHGRKRQAAFRERNAVTHAVTNTTRGRVTPGREGKGNLSVLSSSSQRKKEVRREREIPLPEPFDLTDAMREFGTKAGIDVPYEFGKFKDYHRAHGTRHVDWVSAWRYWVRNGLERLERAQERRR